MNYRWQGRPFIVRDVESGGGGGGGVPDPGALLETFKQKHNGDLSAALMTVVQENFRYREERRDLKAELAKVKIPDGHKVLTADEVKELDAYRALGKPDEVKVKLDKSVELEQKVSASDRAVVLNEAASLAGFKPTVLHGLAKDLAVSIKDVTVTEDGKPVAKKVAYVKDGDSPEIPLTDFATQKWADYLPALEVKAENNQNNQNNSRTFVRQPNPEDKNSQKDIVDDKIAEFEKRRAEKRNPLMPPAQAAQT